MAGLVPGAHRGHVEVGPHAVGDVGLGAVDEPAAVDLRRARARARDVGARVGLGDRQRGDLLAPDRRRQPALLLLGRAELRHGRRGDRGVRADARRQPARPAARELLREHRVGDPVGVRPVLQPEPAALRELLEDRVREPAGGLPLVGVRAQLGLDEGADLGPERLVALRERRDGSAHRAYHLPTPGTFGRRRGRCTGRGEPHVGSHVRSPFTLAVLLIPAAAQAAPLTAGPPVLTSAINPLAGCPPDGSGINYPGAEVEPWIAVNPTNAMNIVGVYQQDRYSNGGSKGTTATVSTNGGMTWTQRRGAQRHALHRRPLPALLGSLGLVRPRRRAARDEPRHRSRHRGGVRRQRHDLQPLDERRASPGSRRSG